MQGRPITLDYTLEDGTTVVLKGEIFNCSTHKLIQSTDSCPQAGFGLLRVTEILKDAQKQGLIK